MNFKDIYGVEININSQEAEKKAWTQDEQTRLEQALRTYGPKEPERWEKIQAAVPTRTKRECKIIRLIIPFLSD